jgi:carbon-monoxide dehydrogenase medium subunit/6-hydroxypseudooxynicotine dehydrogenase subunit alpha
VRHGDAGGVKPASFQYVAPATVDEVLQLLADDSLESKVLAGGQSLIPLMNLRLASPDRLIDTNNVRELAYIRQDLDGLHIGALTRHAEVQASASVRQMCPLLHEAVGFVAHSQVRNRGTIGGTLAHGDAAAEIPVSLLASDAVVTARSVDGERQIRIETFFQGYYTTALEPHELLVDVYIPATPAHTGSSFHEFARRTGDYAVGGAAVTVALDDEGTCLSARIALLAAGPAPLRAAEAERQAEGATLDDTTIDSVSRAAAAAAHPVNTTHGTTEYRRAVIQEMVSRALRQAVQRAGV